MILPATAIGVLLAFAASATIAAVGSFGSIPFVGLSSNPANANYVAVLISTLLTGLFLIVAGQAALLFQIPPLVLVLFVAVGVLQNALARRLWFLSVRHIGANQSNTLVSTEIIYSVIFAVLFLGETLGPALGMGVALVFLGALLIEAKKSALKRSGNHLLGYETALAAGCLFGISPILVKYGLDSFPHSLPALFIAFASAAAFQTVTLDPGKVAAELRESHRPVAVAFLAIGILTAASQLFIYFSLNYAPVVFFAPILSTYPLFTVVFTRIQARHLEVFGYRTILSAALVIAGAVLVSLASF